MKVFVIPGAIVVRKPPVNLQEQDIDLFMHEYNKEIPDSTVSLFNNVFVLGSSLFHTSKLRFLNSYTHNYKLSKKGVILNARYIFNNASKISRGTWITDNWSGGYFHWLTDALPRLMACIDNITDHIVLIPFELEGVKFIIESLDLLGFRYQICARKVFVRNLLLPSHTAESGNYNVHILNRLRIRLGIKVEKACFRNIYISRKKSLKRKVINEESLVALLQEFNFEIHYFEDYSFQEQVELMQQAKTLVGLHGAGLTNILFMPKNGNLLELRNQGDAHNNCYFSLASALNINYYYQQCIGTTNNTHISDVTVPLDAFKSVLKLLTS